VRSTARNSRPRPGLVLQHGKDGPPARLAEWLREREISFVVHPAREEPLPDPAKFAFVVSLGSEESAAAAQPAWVPAEVATLRRAVEEEVPVLGLCFGGQALSVALGGGSDPLERPEIGWLEVESDDELVPTGPWLHYHFELMRLPPGARELARSPAGIAAFALGPHLGVQFHPEVDAQIVERWARTDPKLPTAGVTAEGLAADSVRHAPGARGQAFRLFDGWLAASAS
jgi:GMP synthase-like glutamine amidotransferase